MEGYFVLNERGEPMLERDVEAWTRWFERADRSVARTAISGEITVLTTFRGVGETDESGQAPPLFETRVFGGILAGEERWHRTRAEALVGHERLAEWCRIGNAYNHGLSEDQLIYEPSPRLARRPSTLLRTALSVSKGRSAKREGGSPGVARIGWSDVDRPIGRNVHDTGNRAQLRDGLVRGGAGDAADFLEDATDRESRLLQIARDVPDPAIG